MRQRLRELLADVAKPDEKVLRLTVEAGGCSGFSYRCGCQHAETMSVGSLPAGWLPGSHVLHCGRLRLYAVLV